MLVKKKYVCVTRRQFPSIYLHSQIGLALTSVPLCDRKTITIVYQKYLKQASIHLKSDISLFLSFL